MLFREHPLFPQSLHGENQPEKNKSDDVRERGLEQDNPSSRQEHPGVDRMTNMSIEATGDEFTLCFGDGKRSEIRAQPHARKRGNNHAHHHQNPSRNSGEHTSRPQIPRGEDDERGQQPELSTHECPTGRGSHVPTLNPFRRLEPLLGEHALHRSQSEPECVLRRDQNCRQGRVSAAADEEAACG